MSDLYLDEIEKIKYYKQKIIDQFREQGLGANKEQVQKALDALDLKIAIFSQAFIQPGETLSTEKFNEQKQDIYHDLVVLYKTLYYLTDERVEKIKARIRYELDDLRLKADRFQYLTDSQTVAIYGRTVFNQTNNFEQTYEGGKVTICLGPVTVSSGSYLVPLLSCDEIDPEDVTFFFDDTLTSGVYTTTKKYIRYVGNYQLLTKEYSNTEKIFGQDLIDTEDDLIKTDQYNLFLNKDQVRVENLTNNQTRYIAKNPEIYLSMDTESEISFYVYGASYIQINLLGDISYKNFTDNEILSPTQRQKIVIRGTKFSFDIVTDGQLFAEKVLTSIQDDKLKLPRNYENITDYTVEHIAYGADKTFDDVRVIIDNATHPFYDINYITIKEAQISELEDRQ